MNRNNWIIAGNLTLLSAKPKVGKTRVTVHGIIKPLWFGEPFADGAENPHPAGRKTLLLPYDRNHVEFADECRLVGIPPDEAIVIPALPEDPDGLTLLTIDNPTQIALIRASLEAMPEIKLILVDTLTYSSHRSLSKAEELKAMLDPIMELAQKYGVGVLGLFHVNKEGGSLGVRITERARVLMRLERLIESDRTKLRWFVEESYLPHRPALAVAYEGDAVVFSPDAPQDAATKAIRCAVWLIGHLSGRADWTTYGRLINDAGEAGFAGKKDPKTGRWNDRSTLNQAIDAINENRVPGYGGYTVESEDDPDRTGRGRQPKRYRLIAPATEPDTAAVVPGDPWSMDVSVPF